MKNSAFACLAAFGLGLASIAPLPAHAQPFSTQSFSGGSTSNDDLPGVRFDPSSGGLALDSNCTQRTVPFDGSTGIARRDVMTECTVGNFTFSTSRSNPMRPTMHNQFGVQPHTGWDVWRPN